MKIVFLCIILSGLFCNSLTAQYAGGGGIGNAVGSVSALSLATTSISSGGNGDGNSHILANAVILGTTSVYAGGNGQGFKANNATTILLGTSKIYTGGNGQGFDATTTLAVTMGTASRYTGGSGDRFSSTLSALQVMAIANTMFSGGNGDGFSSADLDRTYIFNGTGNWDINTNWQYCTKPAATLPTGAEIRINPLGSTECILNTPQIIVPGGKITVMPGKILRIIGSLIIQ